MSLKFFGAIILAVIFVMTFVLWTPEKSLPRATKTDLNFEACLPRIVLKREQLLMSDDNKKKKVTSLFAHAEKILEQSADPTLLWEALEAIVLAAEFLKTIESDMDALNFQQSKLQQALLDKQEKHVKQLEMDVLRFRKLGKDKKLRYTLRRLLRWIPDPEHPYHQKWLKELAS